MVDFTAWHGSGRLPDERFFREGMVVLDANVLLDLYRLTPDARLQVLDTLAGVADRLWVPYQAAVEFSRNRKRVVEERISSFKQTRQALQSATANAVDVFESAVEQLVYQRERNGTTRAWDAASAGLDRESLLARLDGVMDAALAELDTLAAEHDLHPQNMQHTDPLLTHIDKLLDGRIGPSYGAQELRALVEEANMFRFPNKIPPGFLDVGKESQLQAAGDFLLWRQTIDRAAQMPGPERLVLLITKDLKADWWDLDARKRPQGPRPELVQELRDSARADLLLLSLKEFLTGAKQHLASAVSDQTLHELREINNEVEALLPDAIQALSEPAGQSHSSFGSIDLLSLSPREFERLIHHLLIRLGYEVEEAKRAEDNGYDFLLLDEARGEPRILIVESKRWRGSVGVDVIRQLQGALLATSADSALLITTGSFTAGALAAVEDARVALIDGATLLQLLGRIGIRATIGPDPDADTEPPET